MPVTKYKSIEDVPKPERSSRDPAEILSSAFSMGLAHGVALDFRGVRKYRNIKEAQADRSRKEEVRARLLASHSS